MGHYMRSVLEREAKRLKEEAMAERYVVRDKDGDLWWSHSESVDFWTIESESTFKRKANASVASSKKRARAVLRQCRDNYSLYAPFKLYRLIPKRKPPREAVSGKPGMPPLADDTLYKLTRNGNEWSLEPVGRALIGEHWCVRWFGSALGVPSECETTHDRRSDALSEAKSLREFGRAARIIHVRRYRRIK